MADNVIQNDLGDFKDTGWTPPRRELTAEECRAVGGQDHGGSLGHELDARDWVLQLDKAQWVAAEPGPRPGHVGGPQ